MQVRTTEGDRYAHLTIELEMNSEADKPAFEGRMARIRDGIIGFVSDRSEDELRGSEGLSQLKEALAKKLRQSFPVTRSGPCTSRSSSSSSASGDSDQGEPNSGTNDNHGD